MPKRHTVYRASPINIWAYFVTLIGAIIVLFLGNFAQPSPGVVIVFALVCCCIVAAAIRMLIQVRQALTAHQHGAGDPPEG